LTGEKEIMKVDIQVKLNPDDPLNWL